MARRQPRTTLLPRPGPNSASERRAAAAVDDEAPLFPWLGERLHRVEVVHAHEIAAPRVEEHQLAEREQLERAAEARAHPAGRLRHAANLAVLAREERHHPVALAEREAADHHRRRGSKAHVRR